LAKEGFRREIKLFNPAFFHYYTEAKLAGLKHFRKVSCLSLDSISQALNNCTFSEIEQSIDLSEF